jgi:MscS family membrane protein
MVLSYRCSPQRSGFRSLISTLAALLLCGLCAQHGQAQTTQTTQAKTPAPESDPNLAADAPVEDSPRSTLTRFFELSRRGDGAGAAKYLELPTGDEARGPELALHLKSVLDRDDWITLTSISAAASGDPDDGLPAGVDEVAKIPVERGGTEPVRLVRRGPADARWLFSRVTVQRIDGWYDALPHRWLLDLAPAALLRMGPADVLWAQWAILPVFLFAVWSFGVGLSRLTQRILQPIVRRTAAHWDAALLRRLKSPLTSAWTLLVGSLLLPWLGLYEPAVKVAQRSIRALLFATFFWALARSVDVAGQLFAESQVGRGAPGTRALLVFASRVGKFFVAALALVALFSELGYQVTSLIAGLGVGGIAVALAAQKSLENLIGAFAIAVDQPLREGDFVRIDNLSGTVEVIGMRSTRIRTLDRTLASIPNGKLADMRIETFAPRDRIRFAFTTGLTYSTSEAQLRTVLKEWERLLREHPKIWPDGIAVRFIGFAESSLSIDVGAFFATTDADEFSLIRQDLLLQYMAVVERVGAEFAFPTRTVELIGTAPLPKSDGVAQPRAGA